MTLRTLHALQAAFISVGAALCLATPIILLLQWTESWPTLLLNCSVITFLVTFVVWWMSFRRSGRSILRAVLAGLLIPVISLFLLMISLWSTEFDIMQNVASSFIMTIAGLIAFGIVLLPAGIAISVYTHNIQMRDV